MFWILQCVSLLSRVTEPTITHSLEFTISFKLEKDGASQQRTIVLDLFGEKCPMTAHNFYMLATRSETPNYQNTIFHRIVKNFVLQGGDITQKNGLGKYSIYNKEFNDEIYPPNVHKKGSLSMANSGKNTNGSQFFIVTSDRLFYLDDKHTVFGQVRPESFGVLKEMDNIPVNPANDSPINEVTVTKIVDISTDHSLVDKISQLAMQMHENSLKYDASKDLHQNHEHSEIDSGFGDSFDNAYSEEMEMLLKKYQREKEDLDHVDL